MYYADLKNNDSRCAGDSSPTRSRRNSSGLAGVAQLLLPQLRRASMQSGGGVAKRRSSMFSMGSVDVGIPEDAPALDHDDHEDDPYYGDNNSEGEGFVCVEEERLRAIYDKINVLRAQQDAELRRKDLTVDALAHENSTLHKRLEVLLADADDRHTVSEYAKLITSTMPPPHVADSNYALNLQTQLCRALKKMGTLEERLRLATECRPNESDPRITELQSKLAEMDEDSFRSDLDRSKDLLSMEMEMERERDENEARLAEKERELEEMRERLELEREAHLRTREALSGADSDNAKARGGGTPPLLPPSSSAVNRPFMENHAA